MHSDMIAGLKDARAAMWNLIKLGDMTDVNTKRERAHNS